MLDIIPHVPESASRTFPDNLRRASWSLSGGAARVHYADGSCFLSSLKTPSASFLVGEINGGLIDCLAACLALVVAELLKEMFTYRTLHHLPCNQPPLLPLNAAVYFPSNRMCLRIKRSASLETVPERASYTKLCLRGSTPTSASSHRLTGWISDKPLVRFLLVLINLYPLIGTRIWWPYLVRLRCDQLRISFTFSIKISFPEFIQNQD